MDKKKEDSKGTVSRVLFSNRPRLKAKPVRMKVIYLGP